MSSFSQNRISHFAIERVVIVPDTSAQKVFRRKCSDKKHFPLNVFIVSPLAMMGMSTSFGNAGIPTLTSQNSANIQRAGNVVNSSAAVTNINQFGHMQAMGMTKLNISKVYMI